MGKPRVLCKTFVPVLLGLNLLGLAPVRGRVMSRAEPAAARMVDDADTHADRGRRAEAEDLYRRAIRLDPKYAKAYERYSMLLFGLRRYAEGKEVAERGLSQVGGSSALKVQLALHLFKLGQHAEAYAQLKPISSQFKSHFDVQAVLAQVCWHLKEYRCTATAVDRYLANRPAGLARGDAGFQVLKARSLAKADAIEEARRILEAVVARQEYLPARRALAEILLHLGEHARAVAVYKKLVLIDRSLEVRLRLGQSLLGLRDYRSALTQANAVLALDAKNLEGLVLKGDAQLSLGMAKEALSVFESAAQLSHHAPEVEHKVATVLFRLGRYSACLDRLATELGKKNADPRALVLAVRAATLAKNMRQALACAGRLVAQAHPTADHYYYAGLARSAAGRFKDAVETLEKAMSLQPRHQGARDELVRALNGQARAAFHDGKAADAGALLKHALTFAPTSVVTRRNLGLVYHRLGKDKEALEQLNRVLAVRPDDAVANRLAGRVLLALGQAQQAESKLQVSVRELRKTGGVPLARVLVEAAVAQVVAQVVAQPEAGTSESAIDDLKQALQIARDAKDKALADQIRRDLTLAHLLRALRLMSRENVKLAAAELHDVPSGELGLSLAEATFARLMHALGQITAGSYDAGRAALRKIKGQVGSILRVPFKTLGDALLSAYADYLNPNPKARQRAAAQLERLAEQLPPSERAWIRELAANAHERLAARAYQQGGIKQATASVAKARALHDKGAPLLRHNLAVLDYASGKKAAAEQALGAVAGKLPLALCNLGVIYEKANQQRKAYEYFSQCARKQVVFPKLNAIVETRRQVFGSGQ